MTAARLAGNGRPPGAWRRFVAAALVFAGLFVGIPAALAACSVAALGRAHPLPAIGGVDEIRAYVERGLTTTEVVGVAVRVLLIVGWVLWLALVVSTIGAVLEARSGSRGRWPRVPLFHGLTQWLAAGLTTLSALSPSYVTADATATRLPFTMSAGPAVIVSPLVPVERPVPPGAVRVLPGESAETFALRTLGDASRWPEIWELNRLRPVGPSGEVWSAAWRLSAGWDLVVPWGAAPATPSPEPHPEPSRTAAATRYVVEPGDTYWEIAEGRLGSGATAGDVAALTDDLVAGNAATLGYDDQTMLRPGDVVTIDPSLLDGSRSVAETSVGEFATVEPGDSYWAIAERRALALHGPEGARSNVVYDLMLQLIDLNAPRLGYDTPEMLHPGDRVWFAAPAIVPARSPDVAGDALAATSAALDGATTSLAPSGPPAGIAVGSVAPVAGLAAAVDSLADAVEEEVDGAEVAASASTVASAPTTTTLADPVAAPADGGADEAGGRSAPLPIGAGEAALAATGVVLLLAARRRARLRAAEPPARVPLPSSRAAATERTMRAVSDTERLLRVDIAVRAAAASLAASEQRILALRAGQDGTIDLRLTGPATMPPPWVGDGDRWVLDGGVLVDDLAPAARTVGAPCLALAPIGVDEFGWDVLADLEAVRLLAVEAEPAVADEVVRGIASALASSVFAEVVHLIGVGVDERAFLDHRLAQHVATLDEAIELAGTLVGRAPAPRSTFELRARHTGGEIWEPAVIVVGSVSATELEPGAIVAAAEQRGVAFVVAGGVDGAPCVLRPSGEYWTLDGVGIRLCPIGLSVEAVDEIVETLDVAPLIPVDFAPPAEFECSAAVLPDGHVLLAPEDTLESNDDLASFEEECEVAVVPTLSGQLSRNGSSVNAAGGSPLLVHHRVAANATNGHRPAETSPTDEPSHQAADEPAWQLMVRLLGPIDVVNRAGVAAQFERSKSLELASWLVTHRERSTRQAARTALWELDVRDTTFANVVSETRRAMARHVEPPAGDEWLRRTLTDELSVHEAVVSDADVLRRRLADVRGHEPREALEMLRPAVAVVRAMPFEATTYLWPDSEGITSNLMLLATSATATFGELALATGDLEAVFWATGLGLKVVAGQETLIALRMRAHAEQGDRSGVRSEWETYLRALGSDPWSDGEPAEKLTDLRIRLLGR